MKASVFDTSLLATWNDVVWPMIRLFFVLVPLVIFGWTAYQACLFVGFARISAEEILTFSIQRVVAIVPFLAIRVLASLTWPGLGSWASSLLTGTFGGSDPHTETPQILDLPVYGDREKWAWFAAVVQPVLVGLCAWLHH